MERGTFEDWDIGACYLLGQQGIAQTVVDGASSSHAGDSDYSPVMLLGQLESSHDSCDVLSSPLHVDDDVFVQLLDGDSQFFPDSHGDVIVL